MVEKKKPLLNSKEREIIRMLHKEGGYMTAHEISAKTGLSYVTVKKYLKNLHDKGVILEGE
ncbi:winged helix-turn-helix domain-containing protein [Candidatus Woesearchaeota archaeon]|nr:winged helix-turn-helix domain-containing protein [Candidatus Woesearchaeota archaeon]